MNSPQRFRYQGYELHPRRGLLECRYELGDCGFTETVTFSPEGAWELPAVQAAARLIFLLAGVSYYKTAAPPVIDLGQSAVTETERAFLTDFYIHGLGEFAHVNGLDLTGLRIEGPDLAGAGQAGGAADQATAGGPVRPLVPFGGGIDSIVTTELVRRRGDAALFILSRPGDRYAAIERPAAVTGLPVVRAERDVDEQLRQDARSAKPRFLNGHVPVTGILSAIAVMAATLDGRDAVVMANEWSASIPTLESGGRAINHQYSKSASFEAGFRAVLAGALGPGMTYFSRLRPFTELWVARQFACLPQYQSTFHSCNRAFYADPARRLDHWCGTCAKCCFIDLILAPFLPAGELRAIFGGHEPLEGAAADQFRALLGTAAADSKPFECVGETGECRAALRLAAQRPDRAHATLLHQLAGELPAESEELTVSELLSPIGEHFIPDAYAADDLLV